MRYSMLAITFLTLLFTGCGTSTKVTNTQNPANAPVPISSLTPLVSPNRSTPAPTTAPNIISSSLQVRSLVLSGHLGWVSKLAWSPDGKILASASGDYMVHDKTARLWKSDGTPLAVLSAHTAEVYALAWSPDGKVLSSGSKDKTIRLWLMADVQK